MKLEVYNKTQLLEKLGISDYRVLKRIVERAGVTWEKGKQIFTPVETTKIFGHWDLN